MFKLQWKFFSKMKRLNYISFFLSILFLINIITLLYFNFVTSEMLFHSDSAVKNILSEEIYNSKNLLLSDWYYVNGDVWFLSSPILITFLLCFFENSFLLHSISASIYAFTLFLSVWYFLSLFSLNRNYKLLLLCFLSSGISENITEALYGQHAYVLQFIIFLWVFIFSYRILFLTEKNDVINKNSIFLFIIVSLVTFSNPSRSLISYLVPIIFGLIFLILSNSDKLESKNVLYRYKSEICLSLNLILAFLLGSLGNLYISSYLLITPGVVPFWENSDTFFENIPQVITAWIGTGYRWFSLDSPIASIRSLYELWRVLFSFILFVFPFLTLGIINKYQFSRKLSFLLYCNAFVFFSTMSLLVFSTLNQGDFSNTARYLVISFVFNVFVIVLLVFDDHSKIKNNLFRIYFLMSLLLISLCSGYFEYISFTHKPNEILNKNRAESIIGFLKEKDLDSGYATYWNSGKLTVLSDFKIKIRQMHFQNGEPIPMRWLGSETWYEDANKKNTFILLDKKEVDFFDIPRFKMLSEGNVEILNHADFTIVVYKGDIASLYPNWNSKLKKPRLINITSKSLHQIGEITNEDGVYSIISSEGDEGFLSFGPFITLNKGEYKVTFNFSDESVLDAGFVDIVSTKDNILYKLNEKKLEKINKEKEITLNFDLDKKTENVEFRVFSNGSQRLKFNGVLLERRSI